MLDFRDTTKTRQRSSDGMLADPATLSSRVRSVGNIKEDREVNRMVSSLREIHNSSSQLGTRRKRHGQVVESVQVHVIKLDDLPEPLSMREFREICLREGLPINGGLKNENTSSELFQQSKEVLRKREQQKWNNTVSNLFGAYLSVFDLFKKWHSSIIQQRHFGPENVEQHLQSKMQKPPFMHPISPNLTAKEMNHVKHQQQLVDLLLQYGLGDHYGFTKSQQRAVSPSNRHNSPAMFRQSNYGPTMDDRTLKDSLKAKTSLNDRTTSDKQMQEYPMHLKMPDPKMLMINDPKKRKFSFSVSEQSSTFLDKNQSDVQVNLDVEVINKQDYEYLDPQDEIQIAKNAVERLRIITGAPNDLLKSKTIVRSARKQSHQPQTIRHEDFQEEQGGGLTDKDLNNETEFYSPLHKLLRKELLETREKLAHANMLLEASDKRNIAIISKYNKEEVDRAVHSKILSLPFPEQAELLRNQIESKFYSATDGLDPQVVSILNQKMSSVKEFFMSQIRLIQHHTDEFREKVDLMETMNKEGIKFSEMDTEKLIERIGMIEDVRRESKAKLRQIDPSSRTKANMNRPQQIWNMLMTHFGSDYFLEVIEEEYGIAPGANEFFAKQIQEHFEHQVERYKREIKQSEDEFVLRIHELQVEIRDLTDRNAELMRHDEKRLEQMVVDHRQNMNMLYKTNEDLLVKGYKAKLKDAEQTVQELVKQRESQYRSTKSLQTMYAWKRWQMFATIKRIIQSVEESKKTGIDYKVQRLCERFIDEEHLCLRYSQDNDVPVVLARHQMFQDELYRHKKKKQYYKNEYHTYKNRADEARARIEDYRAEIEKLQNKTIDALKIEIPILRSQNQKHEDIILLKEKENKMLNESIKTIENRWKNNAKEAYKFTAKPILSALQLKSLNEMSAILIRLANGPKRMRLQICSKAVNTDMQGVRKRIEEVKLVERNNIHSIEIQTDDKVTLDAGMQAEPEREDQSVGLDYEIKYRSQMSQTVQKGIEKQLTLLSGMDSQFDKSQNASNTDAFRKVGRTSFVRPKIEKSKSLLQSKEFQFNASNNQNSRMQNQSQIAGKAPNEAEKSSQHDSDSKFKLRRGNTFHFKKNQGPSTTSNEKITTRKTLGGVKHQTDNDGNSQERSQDRSSQMLKKAPTVDSFIGSDKPMLKSASHMPLLDSKTNKSKRIMRQTINGCAVDTASKGSSQEPTRLLSNQGPRKISPLKSGNHASSKSPDKFDTSNQAATKKQKTQKLGYPVRKGAVPVRLTSAQKQRTQKEHNLGESNAVQRHTVREKMGLKKDSLKPQNQLGINKASNKNSILSRKSKAAGGQVTDRNVSNLKSNSSIQQITSTRNRAQSQLGQTKKGESSSTQEQQNTVGQRMSPESPVNLVGGADLQTDSFGNQRFPKLMLNSFQEPPNATSPMQLQDGDKQADYTTVHPRENKIFGAIDSLEKTKQLQKSQSSIQRKHQTPENLHEGNDYMVTSKQKRPTTVHDTSKDQSRSSAPTGSQQIAVRQHDSIFMNLPKYNQDENSLTEDIVSLETDALKKSHLEVFQRKPAEGLESSSLSPSHHRKNHSSGLKFDLGNELMQNASPDHERNNSLTKKTSHGGGLIFGNNNSSRIEDQSRVAQGAFAPYVAQQEKRLTLVHEQDQEHQINRESSGRVSEFNYKKMSARRTDVMQGGKSGFSNIRQQIDLGKKSRPQSKRSRSSKNSRGKASTGRNKDKHQIDPIVIGENAQSILTKQKSFSSSVDTSVYSKPPQQPTHLGQIQQLMNVEENNNNLADVVGGIQMRQQTSAQNTKIQRLLLEGLINEEQFICLQLLEKGYTPTAPSHQQNYYASKSPENSSKGKSRGSQERFGEGTEVRYFANGGTQPEVKTYTSGFMSQRPGGMSGSASCSPRTSNRQKSSTTRRVSKGFIKNTYKIYPNKIPVLEKIFDRVYAKKKNVGIQCSPPQPYIHEQEQDDIITNIQSPQANTLGSRKQSAQDLQQFAASVGQPAYHLKQRSKKALIVKPHRTLAGKRTSTRPHRFGALSSQQFAGAHSLGGTLTVTSKMGSPSALEAKGYNALPHIASQGNLKVLSDRDTKRMWTNAIETREAFTAIGYPPKKSTTKLKVNRKGQQSRMLIQLEGTTNDATSAANLLLGTTKDATTGKYQTLYNYPERLTNQPAHNLITMPQNGTNSGLHSAKGRLSAQSITSPLQQQNQFS